MPKSVCVIKVTVSWNRGRSVCVLCHNKYNTSVSYIFSVETVLADETSAFPCQNMACVHFPVTVTTKGEARAVCQCQKNPEFVQIPANSEATWEPFDVDGYSAKVAKQEGA